MSQRELAIGGIREHNLGKDLGEISLQIVKERNKLKEKVFTKILGRDPKLKDFERLRITKMALTNKEKIYYDDLLLGTVRDGWEGEDYKIQFIPAR